MSVETGRRGIPSKSCFGRGNPSSTLTLE